MTERNSWIVMLALPAVLAVQQACRTKPECRPPVRVLYVEGYPRFEFHHLSKVLTRSRDIAARVWLASADPGWVHPHSPGLASLTRLPRTLAELQEFDVILIGDASVDDSTTWYEVLVQFVREGGGLGIVSGEHYILGELEQGIDRLFPVEIDTEYLKRSGSFVGNGLSGEYPIQLAVDGAHPILRLNDSGPVNSRIWASLRLRRAVIVKSARRRSTVLLTHQWWFDERKVLAAVGSIGAGRTFFLAMDDTWLWRRHGQGYHRFFWQNVISYLDGRHQKRTPRNRREPSEARAEKKQ